MITTRFNQSPQSAALRALGLAALLATPGFVHCADQPLIEGRQPLRDRSSVGDEDKKWWAFQPLSKNAPPPAHGGSTTLNPIDRFIAAKAATNGLALSASADRRNLIRRANLDLLGLPSSPEEVRAFVNDESPDAWPRLIDRLLASPQHGERWARHWLDVARFAESSGFEHDYDREGAFYYRDFVIKALNMDLPFDQFVRWQVAGDEFEPDNPLALTATGFLGAGVFPTQITANEVERTRYDAMDDMLSTTSVAFLGLTVGCARCHDHKFDPIPSRDYYRMLATFTTTVRSVIDLDLDPEKTRALTQQWEAGRAPLVAEVARFEETLQPKFGQWLAAGAALPAGATWALLEPTQLNTKHNIGRPRLSEFVGPRPPLKGEVLPAQIAELLQRLHRPPLPVVLSDADRTSLFDWWKRRDPGWRERIARVEDHAKKKPDGRAKVLVCAEGHPPLRMHTQGADFFEQTHFLKRGSTDEKDGVAAPGFLQALMSAPDDGQRWQWTPPEGAKVSGRRRALANWLTDTHAGAGALLARVAVNRLWQHHFGRGLVATPNDFGHTGAPPTHPELLDWLAAELIRGGWKLKPIHRLIMTSATYMQSVGPDRAKESADPANQFFIRRVPRRLEGEAIRDCILAVSGALDPAMFGKGTKDERSRRRSIYFTVKRSQLIGSMVAFDQPEPLVSQGLRPVTTVAPQALFILNGPQVREWAGAFAQRLEAGGSVPAREAYQFALGRDPIDDEARDAARFIEAQTRSYSADGNPDAAALALTDFCQVLFGLNEFAYEP